MTNFDVMTEMLPPVFTPENAWAKTALFVETEKPFFLGWELLTELVKEKCAAFNGDAGIVIADLNSGRTLEINADKEFYPGCLIKFPMMVACFQAAAEGRIHLSDRLVMLESDMVGGSGILKRDSPGSTYRVDRLIENMIIYSDNIALNLLIDAVGMDYINTCFKKNQLTDTSLGHKLMYFGQLSAEDLNTLGIAETNDLLDEMISNGLLKKDGRVTDYFYEIAGPESMPLSDRYQAQRESIYQLLRSCLSKTGRNSITARDVAKLFRMVYAGIDIPPEIATRCLSIMQKNIFNDLIPAGLPEGVMISHKTGSTRTVSHDAGIVFTQSGDFILCVLTRHPEDRYEGARVFIRQIALLAYDYQTGLLMRPFGYR